LIEAVGLVDSSSRMFWKLSDLGERILNDRVSLWAAICQTELSQEREALLRAVNKVSPRAADDHGVTTSFREFCTVGPNPNVT
jgi:hypothetical protein